MKQAGKNNNIKYIQNHINNERCIFLTCNTILMQQISIGLVKSTTENYALLTNFRLISHTQVLCTKIAHESAVLS